MAYQARIHQTVIVLFLLVSPLTAQTTPPAKSTPQAKPPVDQKNKTAARDEAKRKEDQRRATAVALLVSLADEAKGYRNQTLRARVQARAADVLWATDVEKSRALFRRAWEAAEVADPENLQRADDERRAMEQAGKRWTGAMPPQLRMEVLRMAARRDRVLGDEFLRKLDEARKQELANSPVKQNNSRRENDPFRLPPALQLRLNLAQQLLGTDAAHALEFADPALGRVSVDGLVFLCYLRRENRVAADERYALMLANAGADPSSDANIVSLLSSYLFTPLYFTTFTPDGSTNSYRYDDQTPPTDIEPELRAAFFRVAEQVFLRPLPPPEQDHTTSGRIGKYLIMLRMLPYFERYSSEQTTTLMRAQMTALSREVPDNYKRGPETPATTESESEDADTTDTYLDRIESSMDPDERDRLYMHIALMAAEKGETRAFGFADKIENTEMRKSVRSYIDFIMVRWMLEKKRTEEALTLTRKGSLTSMQRVWGLTQVARSLVKSDREAAIELVEEAATEARRIGGSGADRTRALIAVATAVYEADRQRGWDMMLEVVRAANSAAEEFTGEDAVIVASLQTRNQSSTLTSTAEDFDLPEIFRALAKEDLPRAILLAKEFNGESPRAASLIAIVRAVLGDKPAASTAR